MFVLHKKIPTGHQVILQTPAKEEGMASKKNGAYDLNKKSILAAHALGTSWFGLRHALVIFGVNYLCQESFEKCETIVGAALKDVAEQSMKNVLLEEVRISDEAGEGTYYTEELGTKPALTLSTDTGWNERLSGCRYNSASSITNMIGGYSKKL